MNRTDSVAGSYLPKIPSQEPLPDPTTIRHRNKPHRSNAQSFSSTQAANMEPRRPVSEQRSRPFHRQQSTTSSSENSKSRSQSRGHGSKPSSRRTSCTIVDPSRPARHYRMKSHQTPPTATSQDKVATQPLASPAQPRVSVPTVCASSRKHPCTAAKARTPLQKKRPTRLCTGPRHVRANASMKGSTRPTAVFGVSSAK